MYIFPVDTSLTLKIFQAGMREREGRGELTVLLQRCTIHIMQQYRIHYQMKATEKAVLTQNIKLKRNIMYFKQHRQPLAMLHFLNSKRKTKDRSR